MKDKTILINLESDRPIINILGEVCWGFRVEDFEDAFGVKAEIVEELLDRLIKCEKSGEFEVFLEKSEIKIIKKALDEVEKEIEEWEFETRIGTSLEEVKKIPIFC